MADIPIAEIGILVFGGSIIGYIGALVLLIWAGAIWVVFGRRRVSLISAAPPVRLAPWQGFLQILRWSPLLAVLHPFPFAAGATIYVAYLCLTGAMPPKADWVVLGVMIGLGKLAYEAKTAH